jgi:pantetheine-phosphate adenylyltransferase
MKQAIYPLSADPIHNGHINDIILLATKNGLFDQVIVAIGNDCNKKYLFGIEERLALTRMAIENSGIEPNKVVLESFQGLLRNYAFKKGVKFLIRGCRNSKDWEYEEALSDFNGEYGLQTLVFPASKEYRNVSSTLIRSVVRDGGLVHEYVQPVVKQALEERIWGVSLIGVTGNMGSGKTTLCEKLVEYGTKKGVEISHIEFDKLVHSVYIENTELGQEIRRSLVKNFGEEVVSGNAINRRKLAEIVFGDEEKRALLAEILRIPSMVRLEEELKTKKGIVLVDAAYFTEYNMLPIVNNNILLVTCDEEERLRRIQARDGSSLEEIKEKIKAQHSVERKREIILKTKRFFYEVDNTSEPDIETILEKIQASFPLGVRA